MKNPLKHVILTIVLASFPVTLYAVYTDSYFSTAGYGTIGSGASFSSSSYNLAVGYNNIFAVSSYSAAIGTSLQNYTSNSTVVGKYNTPTANALFIVGNGAGTGTPPARSNALEVMADGTVNINKVPAKGGIGMGIYWAP